MNPTTIAWGIYACMTARRLMYSGIPRWHAEALVEAVAAHTMNLRGATP